MSDRTSSVWGWLSVGVSTLFGVLSLSQSPAGQAWGQQLGLVVSGVFLGVGLILAPWRRKGMSGSATPGDFDAAQHYSWANTGWVKTATQSQRAHPDRYVRVCGLEAVTFPARGDGEPEVKLVVTVASALLFPLIFDRIEGHARVGDVDVRQVPELTQAKANVHLNCGDVVKIELRQWLTQRAADWLIGMAQPVLDVRYVALWFHAHDEDDGTDYEVRVPLGEYVEVLVV